MIMVDESVDVPISVSGVDPSVPVMVVDESIPVETVVEADGPQNFFLISGAQLEEARIWLEALQLSGSNPLQSLVGNLGLVPDVVDPAVEVETPFEIVPQVNLDALNRFLVDPINAAANAKLNTLNDLGLAAGNIGNILSSNIIDAANAQLEKGLNIINEAANAKLNRLNNLGNTAGDILAPLQEAVQPLILATGPLQNAFDTPAASLIQDFEDEIVKLLKAKAILGAPVFNVGSQILAPFVQLGSNLGGLGIKAGKVGLGLLGGKLALKKAAGIGLAKAGLGLVGGKIALVKGKLALKKAT